MSKTIQEHEGNYLHIPTRFLWLIILLPLGIYNVYLIMTGYPNAPLIVALPSIIFWIGIFVCLVYVTSLED